MEGSVSRATLLVGVFVLLSYGIPKAEPASCESSLNVDLDTSLDTAIIKLIIENLITNNCTTLANLAGVFFEDQEKPPNSVAVTYEMQFPYNPDCESQCPCWKDRCRKECDPGYCCLEPMHYLWGRIPTYVQDSIFRQLTMCSFVIGGVKEKKVTIHLNISTSADDTAAGVDESSLIDEGSSIQQCPTLQSSMPCSWCHTPIPAAILPAMYGLDTLLTVSRRINSPMEKALLSVTAKLQGYAAKLEKVEWLVYRSDLAFGFSNIYKFEFDSTARWVLFLMSYVSFQLMVFMLTYKYRYRIYNNIFWYINESKINESLFWSFILTSILAFSCVLVLAFLAGGICVSVLQIIMLLVASSFGVPHMFVSCFRMKKSSSESVDGARTRRFCCNSIIPKILFSYIYLLPHIILYASINLFISFIAKPFSYLVFFVYFCVSLVFIWIANAIGLHLLLPLTICNRKGFGCRRQFFGMSLLIACNCLNFTTWGFIQVYFYDRRAQTTSLITILPGMTFTLLGWYLSGDLVKLFDMLVVTLPTTKPSSDNDTESSIEKKPMINNDDSVLEDSIKSRASSAILIDSPIEDPTLREVPRRRYNFSRLKRVVTVMRRPTSFITWNSTPERSDNEYVEFPD